jgi:signal transduction histidine kinase/CheY-like chemotaxis protein
MKATILTIEIRFEEDVVMIRQRSRQIAQALGFDSQDQTRIGTAVSEIARNAFQYAGWGKVEFWVGNGETQEGNNFLVSSTPQALCISIRDKGKGIPHLKSILDGQYQSATGMGLGIIGSKRLMDQFQIESDQSGTTVIMTKTLPKRVPQVTAEKLGQISQELIRFSPENPYQEIQQQNQELLRTLEELQKRQAELAQLNRELEDTNRGVVALYAELDEKALSLQKANEIKTRFFSNMSHEFRTPLNSIVSLSDLLLNKVDGELTLEQEKQVSLIRKSALNLTELVNDLLDLAKVEAGKIVIYPNYFEVSDLFATLRGMLRPLVTNNSSVSLVFEEPVDIPLLYTDEGKVAQILRNFISNALKYTQNGEVKVTASGFGKTIIFSVADTGIGIAWEHQKRIFEEFTQVDSDLQKQVKGTGLGLPLSSKLAHLLGGNVFLESEVSKGSTFFAAIPMNYGEAIDESEVAKYNQQLRTAYSSFVEQTNQDNRPKILIVDDQEASRYLLKQLLRDTHFTIIEAADGIQAIGLAKEEHPSVIFLDLIMPNMDGFEVLQHLKANSTTSHIPVIINTSKLLTATEYDYLIQNTVAILSKERTSYEQATTLVKQALVKAGLSLQA